MVMKVDQRIAHERLVRVCMNDYDREIALVAEVSKNGEREVVGVGRLSKIRGTNQAEAAVVVSDDWQNKGIGTKLLNEVLRIAKEEKVTRVTAQALAENSEVQHIFEKKLGFVTKRTPGEPTVSFELSL